MKLLLHILRKDARRLWLPLGVTLVLLGVLAHDDGWRSDSMPGLAEGWLNLLLPLAWALLAALAVHEESLVGDREFWTTRPYRRTALAGAKVVSLLLAIHVPSFLADCAILLVRGFNPLEWMPQLLGKQLLLACWLTIPAAALATVVGSIAHFMLAALAIAAGAAFLGGTLDRFSAPWQPADPVRGALALVPLVAAAAVMVVLQYARRRTRVARIVGIAAAAAASLLFACTPREYTAVAGCGAGALSLRMAPRPQGSALLLRPAVNGVLAALPLAARGFPDAGPVRVEPLALDLVTTSGERLPAVPMSRYVRIENTELRAGFSPFEGTPALQLLWIYRPLYDRIRNGKVSVAGHAAASFFRVLPAAWIAAGANQPVAGVGRCYSVLSEESLEHSGLKVVCESPADIPLYTHVRIWHPESGMEWKGLFGQAGMPTNRPQRPWLSPLNRRQAWFEVSHEPDTREGMRWRIPRDWLSTAKIEIVPEQQTGCASFRYELPDVSLGDYVVPPR